MTSPFECPVCLDAFECDVSGRQPLALPCGHTFCRSCLEKVQPQRCPTCRHLFDGDVHVMAVNFALRDAMAISVGGRSRETAAAQQQAVATELQHKWDAAQQQAADVLAELQRSQHAMAQQMAAMQVEIDNKDEAAQHQAEATQDEIDMIEHRIHLRFSSPHRSSPDSDTDRPRASLPLLDTGHQTFQEVAAKVQALQLEMERRDRSTQQAARASKVEKARSHHASAAQAVTMKTEMGLREAAVQSQAASAVAEQRRTSNVLHSLASQSSLAPLVPLALVALSPPIYTPSSAAFAASLFLRTTSLEEATASAAALSTLQASGLIRSLYEDMDDAGSSSVRPVVSITSDDLDAFADRVNSIITPTTFDLGGRELHHNIAEVMDAIPASEGTTIEVLGGGEGAAEGGSVPTDSTSGTGSSANSSSMTCSSGGSTSSSVSGSGGMIGKSVDILRSGVTLRNGTIVLSEGPMGRGPSLRFSGKGVELEGIIVCGGSVGILVQPGGGATLRGCEIRGAYAGLSVGSYEDAAASPSVLVAHDVKVYGCSEVGLVVGGRGSAVLSDCEFSNGKEHGMGVWGDSDSSLAVTRVQCVRNGGYGLCVLNGGHAALSSTVLKGNIRGSVHVYGEGSRAELWGCTLDRVATTEAGGEVALRE